ncbi:hypothetical protein [Altererythrobacter sp. GH1-8]|uniref:hypothetical protein n=1 Tax=Altererythrobacter sp. GH1-8 TaxID=3349333 RepID=UPI00374DD42A
MSYIVDILIVFTALSASVMWFRASRTRLRRVSKYETLDHADFNRIVTALNRTQILNSQAALATGLTTAFALLRLMLEFVQ